MPTVSSANEGAISQSDAVTAWDAFLAENKVIPLSLISINDLGSLERLVDSSLPLPGNPQMRYRGKLTLNQSEGGEKPSMYDRVSCGGQPIHDNGLQATQGAISGKNLKLAVSMMTGGQYVRTNEGNGQHKDKVELRFKPVYPNQVDGSPADGIIDLDPFKEVLDTIPDESWVGFFLWVNPTKEGWLRFNLVVGKWDQAKTANLPQVPLEPFDVNGVPTLDVEALGFVF